ncbi:hypothetical protein FHX74_001275 [Friedmanniella endophytica]|uniref:Uncharacterized protein n=1 Tax=Microlunatus kandeliicorticis TaxID=1759536 RepID=A0A7W3IR46_9ACTN|nr:hypothetical protein [Microlunatus kandeliicorticis]MBA8793670.1 hypothetical protein [Microlunatus kandeliicorticis]
MKEPSEAPRENQLEVAERRIDALSELVKPNTGHARELSILKRAIGLAQDLPFHLLQNGLGTYDLRLLESVCRDIVLLEPERSIYNLQQARQSLIRSLYTLTSSQENFGDSVDWAKAQHINAAVAALAPTVEIVEPSDGGSPWLSSDGAQHQSIYLELRKALDLAIQRIESLSSGPTTLDASDELDLVREALQIAEIFADSARTYGVLDVYSINDLTSVIGQTALFEMMEGVDELRALRRRLIQRLFDSIAEGARRVTDTERAQLQGLSVDLANLTASRVVADADAVSRARAATEESAGSVAESELAQQFAGYQVAQLRASWGWLIVSVFALAATVGVALAALNQSVGLGWQSYVSHLLVALPCLGLAAYCSREASRHRQASQWAGRLAVQLKSVGAFTGRLSNESRDAVLTSFGHYVFGPHSVSDDNQIQSVPPEIVKAVADAIKARGTV